MMLSRLIIIALLSGLAACGGEVDLTCEAGPYQTSVRGPRVESPEDLDALEELNEMPLPEAAPQPPRDANAPCIDRPPSVLAPP